MMIEDLQNFEIHFPEYKYIYIRYCGIDQFKNI